MFAWSQPIMCPECGRSEARFVEPKYEVSVYECTLCGCIFEIEEETE